MDGEEVEERGRGGPKGPAASSSQSEGGLRLRRVACNTSSVFLFLATAIVPGFVAAQPGRAAAHFLFPFQHTTTLNNSPTDGERLAARWRSCDASGKHFPHSSMLFASWRHRFAFADICKTGSTKVRRFLASALRVNRLRPERRCSPNASLFIHKYQSTECFSVEDVEDLYKFGFVRDPVTKFESGVRQLWVQHPNKYKGLSSDEMMRRQLALWEKQPGKFVHNHLMPSSWFLSGRGLWLGGSSIVWMDFIGKMEHIVQDFGHVLDHLPTVTSEAKSGWFKEGSRKTNVKLRIRRDNMTENEQRFFFLSPESIRAMCRSEIYNGDWACFDYPIPPECVGILP